MTGRGCYVLLRSHYDVLIRRRGDAPRRRLGDISLRRRWVFHLRRTCDVAGTYRETSLRRHHDVLMPGGMCGMNTLHCFFILKIVCGCFKVKHGWFFLTFCGSLDFFLPSSLILFFFGPIIIMFSPALCCLLLMNKKNSGKKHSKIMTPHSNLFHCLKLSSVVYTDEILILST